MYNLIHSPVMRRKKILLLISVIIVMLLVAGGYLLYGKLRPSVAGMLIESAPDSAVFINGEQVGRTPYDGKHVPGEIVIKLAPISFDTPLPPWETKVNLTPGVKTVIRRLISQSEAESAGETISFERIGGRSTAITVISSPDAAQVTLDGQVRGFTPITIDSVNQGQHQLIISNPGYLERSLTINSEPGHKLTAVVKLAKLSSETEQAEGEISNDIPEVSQELVEILDTPTGFLRVRQEPSTVASESARVNPGEIYKLLDSDEESSWYKIEYEEGEEGWISATYAQIVASSSATKNLEGN